MICLEGPDLPLCENPCSVLRLAVCLSLLEKCLLYILLNMLGFLQISISSCLSHPLFGNTLDAEWVCFELLKNCVYFAGLEPVIVDSCNLYFLYYLSEYPLAILWLALLCGADRQFGHQFSHIFYSMM